MLCKVSHCTGCALSNTRPHQLCWGNSMTLFCKDRPRWYAVTHCTGCLSTNTRPHQLCWVTAWHCFEGIITPPLYVKCHCQALCTVRWHYMLSKWVTSRSPQHSWWGLVLAETRCRNTYCTGGWVCIISIFNIARWLFMRICVTYCVAGNIGGL